MSKFSVPLDDIRVSAPCPADWDMMNGDNRVRFCNQCELNVYNLSAMTRNEAENLLRQTEGRLCVRFFRRADGTIITENCPKGLQAIKRRLARTATAMFSCVISLLSGIGAYKIVINDISALEAQVKPVDESIETPRLVIETVPLNKKPFVQDTMPEKYSSNLGGLAMPLNLKPVQISSATKNQQRKIIQTKKRRKSKRF